MIYVAHMAGKGYLVHFIFFLRGFINNAAVCQQRWTTVLLMSIYSHVSPNY